MITLPPLGCIQGQLGRGSWSRRSLLSPGPSNERRPGESLHLAGLLAIRTGRIDSCGPIDLLSPAEQETYP
jgi:hypothetical protein